LPQRNGSPKAGRIRLLAPLRIRLHLSGDKLNTLIGLVINAMQHGMIYVGTGLLPAQITFVCEDSGSLAWAKAQPVSGWRPQMIL
jgi:hypothetical protein